MWTRFCCQHPNLEGSARGPQGSARTGALSLSGGSSVDRGGLRFKMRGLSFSAIVISELDWGGGLGGLCMGRKTRKSFTSRSASLLFGSSNPAFLLPLASGSFSYCLQLTPYPPESSAFGSGCNSHLLADIAPASTRAPSTRLSYLLYCCVSSRSLTNLLCSRLTDRHSSFNHLYSKIDRS